MNEHAASTWPPPPTDERPWHDRKLGRRTVTVREVVLWGQLVLLNETDAIWCTACRRFVSLDEVRRGPTGHPFDKRRRQRIHAFNPDDEPRPRTRTIWDRRW